MGSSPHTRGTRGGCAQAPHGGRDHPRIRGEHFEAGGRCGTGAGIIPAYAGNTIGSVNLSPNRAGSSPHTRGTPSETRPGCRRPGDHPRIRGEHPVERGRGRSRRGIIPAYAGNTVNDLRTIRLEVHSSITSIAMPADRHPYRRALWARAALLQPFFWAPNSVSSSVPAGLSISVKPSQSFGVHPERCTLNAKCCSFRAEWTIIARPSLTNATTRVHSASRTRADTCPTNTPGAISNSQRERSPRRLAGHAVTTITITIVHPPRLHHMLARTQPRRPFRPTAQANPHRTFLRDRF